MSESTISSRITALAQRPTDLNADASLAESGDRSAGTRVRQTLQEAVNESKEIRKEVLNVNNATS